MMNKKTTDMEHRCLQSAFILFAVMLLCRLPLSAQELSVKSMELLPNDATASMEDFQRQDLNGNYAGVVKVMLAVSGATFEGGGVLEQQKHMDGEYWVWLAKDSKRLKVHAPGYLPLELNFFSDYKIMIEPKRTYRLVLTIPVAGQVLQDDGMRYLAMTVEPKNASVSVDGTLQSVENGEVVVSLPMGSHRYQVQAPGYASQEGTVEVGDAGKQLSVRLVSTQATLRVECATSGAQVYVNGQHRGASPWSSALTPGNYKVEVRLEGYRSQQQSVILKDGESRTLNVPALEMISGSLSVSSRPIGSEVYIDGQKVGATPNIFRNIPIGQRRVEVKKDGYTTLTQTVTIEENKQSELSGSLTALSTQPSSNNSSTAASAQGTGGSGNRTFTANGVAFTMVYVEGGTFTMGATSEQESEAYSDEKPAHSVTLSSYYMGETEVTQALWQAVMGKNPSKFKKKGSNLPVEQVSWEDCQTFISKLNSMTGQQFKLPTEAQWEYAARGGNKSRGYKYSGSKTVGDVAWYTSNTNDKGSREVKTKQPNELGLYDMSGNVWEWCQDWYGGYGGNAQTTPTGAFSGSNRVIRGGSWYYYASFCRVSCRGYGTPSNRNYSLGLRLAL